MFVLGLVGVDAERLGAATALPVVDQATVATVRSGSIELTGTDLGPPSSNRALLFDFGSRSATVLANSSLVDEWQNDHIVSSVPWEVVTGQVRVLVDGKPSDPIELLVFDYDRYPLSPDLPISRRPLALATAPSGRLWINQEYSRVLSSLSPAEPLSFEDHVIPQAEGTGIFAALLFGDGPRRWSSLGEDITIDADGHVWFTQGGGLWYSGVYPNTSRLVKYEPATGEFSCFNLPMDNAGIIGVAVDETRGLVWYSEGGLVTGNAIGAITLGSTLSDCSFDPRGDSPRDPICDGAPADNCHWRFPLPYEASSSAHIALDQDGNVWAALFLRNAVLRLTPETGEMIELPFPASIVREGPGIYSGSAPWELRADDQGRLWMTEFFDATLTRIHPDLIESADCLSLDENGQNPCVDEVVVASNGGDLKEMHTAFPGVQGRVWFTLSRGSSPYAGKVGFVTETDEVVFVRGLDLQMVTGVTEDAASGAIWIAEFSDQTIGRLVLTEPPGAPGTDSCVPSDPSCLEIDTDQDGCTDRAELGDDPQYGGSRDPMNFWDFYDTPGLSGRRDRAISLSDDILAIAWRLGASDNNGTAELNRYSSPFAPMTGDPTGYHPAFDRSPAPEGDPFAMGPPDGYINFYDLLGLINQYGHDCGT